MPDAHAETERIMAFLAELSPNTYVNVMDQYYPAGRVAEQPDATRRSTGVRPRLSTGARSRLLDERASSVSIGATRIRC